MFKVIDRLGKKKAGIDYRFGNTEVSDDFNEYFSDILGRRRFME